MPRFNPFRPNSLVAPGMFAGRVRELLALEKVLSQTKRDNPLHFLIQGERGIGKSSLLLYVNWVASGKILSWEDQEYSFLTLGLSLEPTNSYTEILRRLASQLERATRSFITAKGVAVKAWDFLKRFEVMGVKYNDRQGQFDPHELLDDLAYALNQVIIDLPQHIEAILITFDEADKPPSGANLGELAKLLTERLTNLGCGRVSLGLAGLPGVVRKLRDSHKSSPRLFQGIKLDTLLPEEREQVVQKGLADAEEKNGVRTTISEEAINWISNYSEGYPHFIQQYAYSAFDQDEDDDITEQDVIVGAMKPSGALDQLGTNYFHDLYFDQIRSDEYRHVLNAMAQHGTDWVTKQQIRQGVELKEHTLANAIAALKTRRIIIPQEGKKGSYRLPSKSFAVWIKVLNIAGSSSSGAETRE